MTKSVTYEIIPLKIFEHARFLQTCTNHMLLQDNPYNLLGFFCKNLAIKSICKWHNSLVRSAAY